MILLFAGDSITGWSDLTRYLKYPHLVECMVAAARGEGRCTVLNRGIGGNTTADLLARLPGDVLDARPDACVLLIGGNDAAPRGLSRQATEANLGRIITDITAICPRLLLMQYHLLPWPTRPGDAWRHLVTNNDLIAHAAASHRLPLLDMHAAMRSALDDATPMDETDFRKLPGWRGITRYRTAELVGPDGVHLAPGGELVYARAVFAKLRELNWLDA